MAFTIEEPTQPYAYDTRPPIVGFDLDGVIFPDIEYDWRNGEFEGLLAIRNHMMPIFKPTGLFFIITGRPEVDRGYTTDWLVKYGISPVALFMNPVDKLDQNNYFEDVVSHKSNTINRLCKEYHLVRYVESDINQANEIRKRTTIPVIHFMDYVAKVI
jgi:hypothetical protein